MACHLFHDVEVATSDLLIYEDLVTFHLFDDVEVATPNLLSGAEVATPDLVDDGVGVLQVYRCMLKDGTEVKVDNPAELPDDSVRDYILEPYVRCPCQLAPALGSCGVPWAITDGAVLHGSLCAISNLIGSWPVMGASRLKPTCTLES